MQPQIGHRSYLVLPRMFLETIAFILFKQLLYSNPQKVNGSHARHPFASANSITSSLLKIVLLHFFNLQFSKVITVNDDGCNL